MKCHKCSSEMNRAKLSHVIEVGADRFEVEVLGWECPEDGETLVEGDQIERAELAVASELACAGRVNKDSFRFLRVVLRWSGREAAERLGVTPETISRWENGQRELERFAWLVLASIVRDKKDKRDDTQQLLDVVNHPRPLKTSLKPWRARVA